MITAAVLKLLARSAINIVYRHGLHEIFKEDISDWVYSLGGINKVTSVPPENNHKSIVVATC